jgi:hypothetical protein
MKEQIRPITEKDAVALEKACKTLKLSYKRMDGFVYEVEIDYAVSLYYLGVHVGMDRIERMISKNVV